jgi:16S rRNA (uracil1498-N3)-methyltransferase
MGDVPTKAKIRRKQRYRFYVPASNFSYPAEGQPLVAIDRDTAHHMNTVLRLPEGAEVVLFDNSGQEYEGIITSVKPTAVKVRIERALTPKTESPLRIIVAQALLKGGGIDRVLSLGTELGCSRFIPIITSRTVAHVSEEDQGERLARWERIVQEAAAQCGRVKVPKVDPPFEFKDFLERKFEGKKIILWERGGSGQLKEILEGERREEIVLLAGPEGGFGQVEVKAAVDAGYDIWGLGNRTLRAENAAAIAIGILQYLRGDMG